MLHPRTGTTGKTLYAYSYGAIWLHWLIALAIIAQLAGGFTMMHIAAITDHTRFLMYQWHKTTGILILLLTLARIVWRLVNRPPDKAPMLRIESLAAGVVSFLFYALMLAVPLAGWFLVSVSPTRIPTLLFLVPSLVWPDLPVPAGNNLEILTGNAHAIHAVLAYSFIFLLFLHVGGALKHSFIDHVPEMSRMLPTGTLPHKKAGSFSAILATLVFLAAGLGGLFSGMRPDTRPALPQQQAGSLQSSEPATFAPDWIPDWIIDKQSSSISFEMDFSGAAQKGRVENWHADIRFDAASPATAQARIIIDAASIRYDNAFVAGNLSEPDGLDTKNHPQIVALLDKFTRQQNDWLATGSITIRGITQPLALHFTYTGDSRHAYVTGNAEIDRLAFDIGRQNDPDAAWLGKTVHVKIQLEAGKK